MPVIKNNLTLKNKILFGASKLVYLLAAFYAVLFFPFVTALEIPLYFLLPVVVLATTFPLLIFPYLYDLINSSRTNTTGRYHLPLAVSVLMLGFFSGLLFSIELHWSFAARIITLLFSLMLTVTAALLYFYTTVSIGSRYCEPGDRKMRNIQFIYIFASALIFGLMMVFLYDNSAASIRNCAYFVSCVVFLSGLCVYLVTASKMPHYLRIYPPKERTFFLKYIRFFTAVTEYENTRFFLTLFLYCMSLFMLCFSMTGIKSLFSLSATESSLLAMCVFVTAAVTLKAVWHFKKYADYGVFAVGVSLIALIVRVFWNPGHVFEMCLLSLAAVGAGISVGAFVCKAMDSAAFALKNCETTKGRLTGIINLIVILAFAAAFLLTGLSLLLPAFVLGAQVFTASASLIAVFIITIRKKMYLTLEFPKGNDD